MIYVLINNIQIIKNNMKQQRDIKLASYCFESVGIV
jgi:hypothetical protein